VGHTHEDIDQFFSCLSQHLGTTDSLTPQSFLANVQDSGKLVEAEFLTGIWNIKDWLTPFMNKVDGHSTPHYFLWQRDQTGRPVFYWKGQMNEEWTRSQTSILHSIPVGEPIVDKGNPQILAEYERKLPRLMNSGILTEDEVGIWRTWIQAQRVQPVMAWPVNRISKVPVRYKSTPLGPPIQLKTQSQKKPVSVRVKDRSG
jgi:hypothetical protein